MNKDQNIQLKISRYLNDEMSAGERKEFELEMDSDENLAAEFMKVISGVYEKKRIEKQIVTPQKGSVKRGLFSSPLLKAAAIVILLIGIAAILYINLSKPQTLLTDNYLYYPSMKNIRSMSDNGNSSVDRAFGYYTTENYRKATVLFEQIADTSKNKNSFDLYAGISLLHENEKEAFIKAITHLKRVLSTENQYNDAAQWFLAIAYYEAGNKQEAKKLFKQISNSKRHYKKAKATEVLKDFRF